jgi:hypothetical protein
MELIQRGKWVVDLDNSTCYNTENDVVIFFEKRGTALMGKFKKIPIKLAREWMKDPNWENYVKKEVNEADKVFFNVSLANDIGRV